MITGVSVVLVVLFGSGTWAVLVLAAGMPTMGAMVIGAIIGIVLSDTTAHRALTGSEPMRQARLFDPFIVGRMRALRGMLLAYFLLGLW